MTRSGRHAHGFSLLELLVSIAIFTLLAVTMYTGTQWVIEEREIVLERTTELAGLQRTVRLLNNDFAQLYPRMVRDELGRGRVAALITDRSDTVALRLTRAGWRNPAGGKRSALQRVQYRHDRDTAVLYRDTWPVLDRVLGMEPREQELLEGVEDFDIEFLDAAGEWRQDWPPVNAQGLSELPQAVRYRIETRAFGEITRLVEIPG